MLILSDFNQENITNQLRTVGQGRRGINYNLVGKTLATQVVNV